MYKYKYKYKYANMNENLIQSHKEGIHIFENPSISQPKPKKIYVKNDFGYFVTRFDVEFDLGGLPMYSPVSKNFTITNSGTLTIPANAYNVKVIIEAVGGKSCEERADTFPACYTVKGVLTAVKCTPSTCPTLSNTSDYEKESFVSQQEQPNPCVRWDNTDLDLTRPNYFFEHTNAEGYYFKLYTYNKDRGRDINRCYLNNAWTNRISSMIVAPNTFITLCKKDRGYTDSYKGFENERSDRYRFSNLPDYGYNDFNSIIDVSSWKA